MTKGKIDTADSMLRVEPLPHPNLIPLTLRLARLAKALAKRGKPIGETGLFERGTNICRAKLNQIIKKIGRKLGRSAKIAQVLLWARMENIIVLKENAKCRLMPTAIFSSQLIKKYLIIN